MAFGIVALERRLKENIKNYKLDQLLDIGQISDYLKTIARVGNLSILLVDRHGQKAVSIGDFAQFTPDVVQDPGEKIRVYQRTVAHLYLKEAELDAIKKEMISCIVTELSRQATLAYENMETSLYADELEKLLEKEQYRVKHGEKMDALTGTLNNTYFENRTKVIDRSEVVPVAIICANINDWKYADDHFGNEESNRLIQTVARFIKEEARDEYIIARCGGDFFHILIPMAEEGEAEAYCQRIQEKCDAFEDDKLAPSVACGIVYKNNVEQSIADLLPDAEYEMFSNKLTMKSAPGYESRLKKA